MAILRFDTEKAREQAAQIEQIAEELRQLTVNDYGQAVQGISVSWRGAGADIYRRKAGELQGQLERTARELGQLSQSVRMTVRTVEAFEERIRQIAVLREY